MWLDVIEITLPLFLLVGIGTALYRFNIADTNWQSVLNKFALYLGFPCLIFVGLQNTTWDNSTAGYLILLNSLFIGSCFLLSILIGRVAKLSFVTTASMLLCIIFSNTAYLGIPVLERTFGDNSLGYASLISSTYLFWMFTAGISYISNSKNVKLSARLFEVVKNPLLIAVLAGIAFKFAGFKVYPPVMASLDMLGKSVTPVVLIALGIFIGAHFKEITNINSVVITSSALTLIVLPALLWLVMDSIDELNHIAKYSIIDAAMPVGVTPFALAEIYKLDQRLIGSSIVITTLISLVTLPLWLVFLS